jgi:uncharacterized membrane protein
MLRTSPNLLIRSLRNTKDFIRLKQKENLVLLAILVAGAFLRFYRLGSESLWSDELFTMDVVDPAKSLDKMFVFLKCCDTHPPLFYLGERAMLVLFGTSEFTARLLPALAGVAGIGAMYFLGAEISGRRLGLVAATLTAFNFYHIGYSREARMYSLLFLFGALSFAFLFRLIRQLRSRDMWLYSCFALLTLYTQYFGIFLICSQFAAAVVLFFWTNNKVRYAKLFAVSGGFLLAAYAVWLPFLLAAARIRSFWIDPVDPFFFIGYFKEYFGRAVILSYIAGALLILYFLRVLTLKPRGRTRLVSDPYRLSLAVFSVSILLTYLIPYLRSTLVLPMLVSRYTIAALPALLVCIGYGLSFTGRPWVQSLLLTGIIGLSLYNTIRNRMYSPPTKPQFRELAAFLSADGKCRQYPLLNERTARFDFYFKQFHYRGPIIAASSAGVIDSIIHRSSPKYDVEAFWLVDAPTGSPPDPFPSGGVPKGLDSAFVLEKEGVFYQVWGKLYRRR